MPLEVFMNSFSPFCPVDVSLLERAPGEAALRELLSPRPEKLLVLAPRFLCTELSLAPLFSALQGDGHCLHLVTDIPSNPSVDRLAEVLAQLRGQGFSPTCILAIGGGSCMDMAKGISALWNLPPSDTSNSGAVREAIQQKKYLRPGHAFPAILVMPTTSGTGSEVTHWATIWDTELGQKLSIDCVDCYPKAAILIPEWTAGMPASLALSTGLDALSHAMEAFWAKARTPLSQALALTAVDRVRRFLPQVLAAPQEIALRREMCLASLLAGLAFSQTRTTACHSLSYPLTLLYGLPHGYAAAITLASVMERNRAVLPEIEELSSLFDEDEGFLSWLEDVTRGIQTLRLSAFGIPEEDLPSIAQSAFTTGRMDNNPIVFTPEESLEILRECL